MLNVISLPHNPYFYSDEIQYYAGNFSDMFPYKSI